MSDHVLSDLGVALEDNHSLKFLDISGKPHLVGKITKQGLRVLENALQHNFTLKRVNVHNHAASKDRNRHSGRERARSAPTQPGSNVHVISMQRKRTGSVVRHPRRGIFFFW